METFTKLFSSIIHSTVWREPNHVRLVWVTMLALADRDGYVGVSVPGLADAARVSLDECVDALARFQKPDTWSRSQEHAGRRIETVDRGFMLLNYKRFREKRDEIARQEQNAEAQARWRKAHPETAREGRKARKQNKPRSAHAEEDQRSDPEVDQTENGERPRARTRARRAPPKRPAPIPNDWAPSDQHRAFAAEHALDLELQKIAFLGHYDGQTVKSPNGRFTTWLARAVDWARERGGSGGGAKRGAPRPVSSAADFAAEGPDDFDALRSMAGRAEAVNG